MNYFQIQTMKKTTILLALAVAALGFTSCEDDKEPVYTAPSEFVLNTPPMAESMYVLSAGDYIDLTCSQPDYGYSAVTNYVVDITNAEEFIEATDETAANYATLTPVNKTSATIELKAEDVAKAICEFNGITGFAEYPEEGLPATALKVRARASLTGIAGSEITSNVITLKEVLPYNPYPAVPGHIYIVGALTNWGVDGATPESFKQWALEETGVGTNVFVGSFNIPAGEQYFRFYQSLGNWGKDGELPSIGPNANDGDNTQITFTDKPQTVPAVPGKGCWYTSSSWEGGDVTFTVNMKDLDNITVTVVTGAVVKEDYVYLVGNPSGWKEPNEDNKAIYDNWKLVDRGETGIYTATFDVPAMADGVYFRIYPELTGWGPTPYSAAADGSNVNMSMSTPYTYTIGEGCWTFAWDGGELTFTLDTHTGTVTVTPAAAE